jgi:hypothetical protein
MSRIAAPASIVGLGDGAGELRGGGLVLGRVVLTSGGADAELPGKGETPLVTGSGRSPVHPVINTNIPTAVVMRRIS